jgi:hypothetical protein
MNMKQKGKFQPKTQRMVVTLAAIGIFAVLAFPLFAETLTLTPQSANAQIMLDGANVSSTTARVGTNGHSRCQYSHSATLSRALLFQ